MRLVGPQSRYERGGEEKNSQLPSAFEPFKPDRPDRSPVAIPIECFLQVHLMFQKVSSLKLHQNSKTF
jgi:hypothetical protein